MAYNMEYPYTDPNRHNTDWEINTVKNLEKKLDSWESTIEQLIAALREINEFDSRITALENATADLNTIRNNIRDLYLSFQALSAEDARLNERINAINTNYDNIIAMIEQTRALFEPYLELAKNYTDIEIDKITLNYNTEIAALQRQIDEIKQIIAPENLINRIRNINVPVQKAYDLTYADMRDDALTVAQYDELGLTSNQYNGWNLTALEFALHSRSIFKWDYVTAPISGLYKSISRAMSEIVTFVLGSFTADEYAALDLTADAYEALNLTAMDYLAMNVANRTLTSDNYSDIIISGDSGILRL